jgi:hypothetical protein
LADWPAALVPLTGAKRTFIGQEQIDADQSWAGPRLPRALWYAIFRKCCRSATNRSE